MIALTPSFCQTPRRKPHGLRTVDDLPCPGCHEAGLCKSGGKVWEEYGKRTPVLNARPAWEGYTKSIPKVYQELAEKCRRNAGGMQGFCIRRRLTFSRRCIFAAYKKREYLHYLTARNEWKAGREPHRSVLLADLPCPR